MFISRYVLTRWGESIFNFCRGSTSDMDGDTAVVISHNDIGAAWVFSKNKITGTWESSNVFQTTSDDYFGWDVSLRGDLIVIGAPAHEGQYVNHAFRDDYRWWQGRGAAAVFEKEKGTNGDWFKRTTLLPKEADPTAAFGCSVDASNGTIAVG